MEKHDMSAGEMVMELGRTREMTKAFALETPILRINTFHSGSLSALVASLPALVALRESFPGARLTCFARSSHIGLLEHFRACDEAHVRPAGGVAGQAALMARLHAGEPDLAISFSQGANAMLLLWSTRAPRRAGFVPSHFEAFLTHRVPKRGLLTSTLALELVELVGAQPRGGRARDWLDVPQSLFDSLRAQLPFDFEQFVLVPFDTPIKSATERAEWVSALLELRASWPVVVTGGRPADWTRALETPAPYPIVHQHISDALTILALIRASRAVVGTANGATDLARFDGKPTLRLLPADAYTETRRMLGL
ncbi:hypothetical protein IAD21_04120 [Abditibacteriota bacterium]|nr:hypothetical protein IAD21_04120 [Abditibacteriota bacterium]